VLSDYSTTGDGLIAALQVLALVVQTGQPASAVCSVFQPVPQILKNVRYTPMPGGGTPLDTAAVQAIVAEVESGLGEGGRLVIRKSGTEPLIRVMGEADDADLLARAVDRIAGAVAEAGAAAADPPKAAAR
jgi:phosphoglucosamine mutase